MLIDVAMRRNNEEENFKRAQDQAELVDEYYAGVCDDVEHRMQTFTRKWLSTYSKATRDVRFLPLDASTPAILQQAREWLSAQHILAGRDTEAAQFGHLSVPELYRQCYEVKRSVDTLDELENLKLE